MWQIVGWIIWSIVTLLAVWAVLVWRIRAKSGEAFNWGADVIILSLWVISILFLIFDWNKFHLLWIVPIAFITMPPLVMKKVPIVSPFILSAISLFSSVILVGVKVESSEEEDEREIEDEGFEDESETEDEVQIQKQDPLGKYKRIRELGRELTGQMMKHAPKFVITRVARDLNLRGPKGILVFDSESDTPFMMDRCFYDIYWDGKNLIRHFIESEDYEQLSEEEKTIVQGMTTAYYSLFEVVGINPFQATLDLNDLLGEETYRVTDINLSRTTRRGYLLATRIKQIEDMYMTTGVGCPFKAGQKQNLFKGIESKKISGRKMKARRLQRSDYSAYFFKQFKQIGDIKFMAADELE